MKLRAFSEDYLTVESRVQVNEESDPQQQPKAPKRSGVSTKNIPYALRPGNYLLVRAQELLNYAFDPSLNPLYFLGSITFLLFWVLLGTGTYLFMFYQMNPVGAYESIQYMTEDQKYYGGIIRSFHRYAADGLVIAIGIHILQVLFSDRFRKYRWFAWVSGAVILPVIWFEGASGYFLVWDESAQMLAMVMGDLINALPMNAEPFPRAFLINDSVNPTLFFVMDFLHLAVPNPPSDPGVGALHADLHAADKSSGETYHRDTVFAFGLIPGQAGPFRPAS